MTYEDSLKAIYILQANYPSFFARQTADQADAMVLSWEACFADYGLEIVRVAIFKLLLIKKNYPPTIADINAEICKMLNPKQSSSTGEEAWGTAYSLIGKYGSVNHMFPEVAEKLNAEIAEDEALRNAIRAMGGLRSISLCEKKDLNILRAQFIRIYDAYATRITENTLLPESIKARIVEETKALTESQSPKLSALVDTENIDIPSATMPESVIDIMKDIIQHKGAV